MTWTGPHSALDRFLRYVQINTESDPLGEGTPSTQHQFDLARLLGEELQEMGAADVVVDNHAYVYATIPATVGHDVPTLCFCSHMDTSPDVTGANVKPQVHRNYRGGPIVINEESGLSIDPHNQPYLEKCLGHSIVTASGDTLLGADDKAGVAAIMDAAQHLLSHPEIPHGRIRVLFTPDEEIGAGVDALDLRLLNADFAYTLDGGERGSLEGETFSADGVEVVINGVSAHPGYAKGKLVNALRAAGHLITLLPLDKHSPESTEGRDGFVHLVTMKGSAEQATLSFLLRDFDTDLLDDHFEVLAAAVAKTREAFPAVEIRVDREEQYRNLGEILSQHPEVISRATKAIQRIGFEPRQGVIRGGTDGSRLSFMGLPCPNLFTGMQMIHSRKEWVCEYDLNLSASMVVELARVWAEETEPGARS